MNNNHLHNSNNPNLHNFTWADVDDFGVECTRLQEMLEPQLLSQFVHVTGPELRSCGPTIFTSPFRTCHVNKL